VKEYYEQVNVPKAPEEPDERIDKMTGMPYDVQAGEAFIDEEDRFGFAAGGLIAIIKRLSRGVDDIVEDTRPTTRFNADDGTRETLRDFRYREPENFVDPNSPDYSVTRVSKDNADNNIEYQQPDNRYFEARRSAEDRLAKELDDEFNAIPEDDLDLVQRYVDDIPKVSDRPPVPSSVSKEEFLQGSVEQKPQYNGRFFSETRYDNPLSARIPRELGMHIGTKGQSETILMRGTHPTAENMIERVAIAKYMDDGMTESQARVAVVEEGVPDEVMDFIVKELNESVPIGVEPSLQQGFINVKNPLVLDTDMINWNPAKFLGGSDPSGNLKLAEQAQTFVDALNKQVKLPDAQFTQIVDDASAQIDSIIRKKDMNSGKLLNAAYDHNINIVTRNMLEDLGFDSIQYRNLGELTRVSERQAGGNSYILFKEDQFATDFVPAPRQAADAPFMRQPRTLKETIPEVQKAYDDLKAGTITSDEYDKIVNNTVYPYENVPIPETDEAMFTALAEPKRKNLNTPFEEGQEVGLRLDIPAYLRKENSAWVPTIHVNGKPKGHQSTAAIRDVDFTKSVSKKYSTAELAQGVMEGKPKSPFAQMMGKYIDRNAKQNYDAAVEALDSDEWIQVGFDPRRHSFFYDRVTGQPVATAEEVIQVGPLVLAKKATYADRSLYPYATGGRVLRSLGRTRRAEGGVLGAIERGIKKGAKLLGFDDEKQLRISADATDLTKQIDPNREVTWMHQGKPITTDQLRNLKSNRDQIGLSGNEELFDTVNHSLFGYETGSNPVAAVGGQLKELYQGTKEALQGRDWRTQAKDAYNNQFGIIQRSKGLSRTEFDMELAKAVQRTQDKLQRGERLIFGRDVILNPYDIMRKEER